VAERVNETFAAGSDSQRYYDHVEPLDGITIGFGNWPQAEVSELLGHFKTSNNGKAWSSFLDCMTEFFSLKRENTKPKGRFICDKARARSTAGLWDLAQKKAGLPRSDLKPANVEAVLEKTALSPRYKKNCKKNKSEECLPGQPNMFDEQGTWLVPALCHALRDREGVLAQVDFWTDTIIEDSTKLASEIGLEGDEATIVAIAAYRSSYGAGSFQPIRKAPETGSLSGKRFRWNWNRPPSGAQQDADGLQKWRRLVLWQRYADLKSKFRDRSIKYFELYLAKDWVLPARGEDGKPDWKNLRNLNPALVKPTT
jgi:hypothetical protein